MKVINGRRIREFINECEQMPSEVTEFNDGQWATFVDRVTICRKDDIRFTLTSGTEVRT